MWYNCVHCFCQHGVILKMMKFSTMCGHPCASVTAWLTFAPQGSDKTPQQLLWDVLPLLDDCLTKTLYILQWIQSLLFLTFQLVIPWSVANMSRTRWNTENSSDHIHYRMYSILWYPDSGLWYPDEIVRNHVAPFVQNHGPGIVLQYDGARPRGARVVQNELQVRNTTPCPGQPFSPTSLAEHVLDELKCWLQ